MLFDDSYGLRTPRSTKDVRPPSAVRFVVCLWTLSGLLACGNGWVSHETVAMTATAAQRIAHDLRDLGYPCESVRSLTRRYEVGSQRTFYYVALCRDGQQHRIRIHDGGRVERLEESALARSAPAQDRWSRSGSKKGDAGFPRAASAGPVTVPDVRQQLLNK